MKAQVKIDKTFDESTSFKKEWSPEDFKRFFEEEGAYIDRLCQINQDKGSTGDGFTITYTVTVQK